LQIVKNKNVDVEFGVHNTIQLIPTKQTTTSNLKSLEKGKNTSIYTHAHLDLAWDIHKIAARLKQLINSV